MKIWNNTLQKWYKAAGDEVTDAITFVDYSHHEIHSGKHWHVEDDSADLGAETGDLITIQFTTPTAASGKGFVHAIFEGFCGAAYTFDLREAQSGGGAGGAALTAYNHRRDSSNTHGMSFLKDSAVGTGGTVLFTKYFGAGVGSGTHGGTQRNNNEWILKQNTLYQVRVYSANAAAAYVSMDFYLHNDRH